MQPALRSVSSMTGRVLRASVAAVLAVVCSSPSAAHAEEPRTSSTRVEWRERYDAAREDLVDGRFRRAELALRALAVEASTASDRALAIEMARLASEYAERAEAGGGARPRGRDIRTTDELTLLYASSFLYGVGTGTWFLLQVQPDSAITATLPFAALTAAPVIAIATIDGYSKLPRGVPHSISSGLYLGLAEGIWLSGFQRAHAERIKKESDPASELRWSPETTATVLWASATTGAVLGGALGSSLVTTPGRVSFTASTALWSGAIVGLATGGLHPDDERRSERAFLAGGVGLNAGIAAGLLLAGEVAPSVARVRLVDLLGVAGAVTTTGLYLSLASGADARTAEGLASVGALAGLGTGWLVTASMPREEPRLARSISAPPPVMLEPAIRAVPGGATFGVGGTM